MTAKVRVIILAAGMSSRMKNYTVDKPKCLLELGNKTLLQRQLESFAANGLDEIHLVRGYKKEKITYTKITYHDNPDFQNNNILCSLFCAESVLEDHVVVTYSDILFEPQVVGALLKSSHDISIVVDIDWHDYYIGRHDHPVTEAENVVLDANGDVLRIGKNLTADSNAHGEFIGMMKFSPRGADVFKRNFHRARNRYWNKPFQRASIFQQAYLTDLIQEIVDQGVSVHCVIIKGGWKEIDTVEDYEKALQGYDSCSSR